MSDGIRECPQERAIVEAVARAIKAADPCCDDNWDYTDEARAAITAYQAEAGRQPRYMMTAPAGDFTAIEAALREPGHLVPVQQGAWQDISTAPKDGDDTLVTDARVSGGFPQVVYWEEGRWHLTDGGVSYRPEAFTHWRRDCLTTPSMSSGPNLADANSKSPIQAREE